jgi:hypothetical protein
VEIMRKTSFLDSNNDATLGKEFIMPVIRPMSFFDVPDIPRESTLDLLRSQQHIIGPDSYSMLSSGVENAGQARGPGFISTKDIFHGLVAAGVGSIGGYAAAHVLGTLFSRPPEVKARMAQYGAIGGAILNTIPLLTSKLKERY